MRQTQLLALVMAAVTLSAASPAPADLVLSAACLQCRTDAVSCYTCIFTEGNSCAQKCEDDLRNCQSVRIYGMKMKDAYAYTVADQRLP